MAVTPVAGEVLLALFNDKSAAIPPITFPGFNLTEKFSWSIWVYPLGQRGDPSIAITDITGTDGSRIAHWS